MNPLTGRVFDIKRFAVHDGPGIRVTIFLKGCPLRCWWCHNPEATLPDGCGIKKVQKLNGVEHSFTESIDREMTIGEVMEEIKKEMVFMEESDGGVTFSGGEPFVQTDFLLELLAECKRIGIHTVIDTSGYTPGDNFEKSFPLTDLYLFDIKLVDPEEHERYTGRKNHLILENLRLLAEKSKKYRIRVPVVPGINTSSRHLNELSNLIETLKNPPEGIDLLPYHNIGVSKYERFGIGHNMDDIVEFKEGEVDNIKKELSRLDLEISIGG